jgi:hypothetical protein
VIVAIDVWFHLAIADASVSSAMIMVDTSAPHRRPVSAVALTSRATLSVTAVGVLTPKLEPKL